MKRQTAFWAARWVQVLLLSTVKRQTAFWAAASCYLIISTCSSGDNDSDGDGDGDGSGGGGSGYSNGAWGLGDGMEV